MMFEEKAYIKLKGEPDRLLNPCGKWAIKTEPNGTQTLFIGMKWFINSGIKDPLASQFEDVEYISTRGVYSEIIIWIPEDDIYFKPVDRWEEFNCEPPVEELKPEPPESVLVKEYTDRHKTEIKWWNKWWRFWE